MGIGVARSKKIAPLADPVEVESWSLTQIPDRSRIASGPNRITDPREGSMNRAIPTSLALAAIVSFSAHAGAAQQAISPESGRSGAATPERPIPYPVTYSSAYTRALERGTRTSSGAPGSSYWQQWAEYTITAHIHPAENRLEGEASILYHNNSPDTLGTLSLNLYQNLHAEGAPRSYPSEVTGGTRVERIAVNGQEIVEGEREGPRYTVSATRLTVHPPQPVAPGTTTTIEIDWSFDIPRRGAGGRMGWRDDHGFFMAYWYPQMAVYDDVTGWQDDWFLGVAEFYAGFADYSLTVVVPQGWVVASTGVLQSPQEVLAAPVIERLQQAAQSDTVVHVLTADDYGSNATAAGADGTLSWRFKAHNVRDVAFAASNRFLWDAARTPVGDRDGDGDTDYTLVQALYRETTPRWAKMVPYEQHSITFESEYTGLAYPWPHMTAVESGYNRSGMEYPMMTRIGHYNASDDTAFYHVTAHELAHMWLPMIVNSDERRYAWMDEGAASFIESQAAEDLFPGRNNEALDMQEYVTKACLDSCGEVMRWSDQLDVNVYGVTSYQKPATLLAVLRGLLGEETFLRAYRTYIGEWAFKHPYPWDMFSTFERVSGRDLGWFWRSWYFENWTLDQAVAGVEETSEGTRIIVEDRGLVPMPVRLTITREGGQVIEETIPVDTWLAGAARAAILLPPGAPVARVEIDAAQAFPDVDRSNNVWTR
jgi:hypothetical protein